MVQYTIPNFFRATGNFVRRNVKNLNRAGLLNIENAVVVAAARAAARQAAVDVARGLGPPAPFAGGLGLPRRVYRPRRRGRLTRMRPRRYFRRRMRRFRRRRR